MKKLVGLAWCVALITTPAFAQLGKPVKDVVELELLTHTEVIEKQKAGMTSVLIVNGGTEARGLIVRCEFGGGRGE